MQTTSNIAITEQNHTALTLEIRSRNLRIAEIIRRATYCTDATVDFALDGIGGHLTPSVEALLEEACDFTDTYQFKGASPAACEDWLTAMEIVVNALGCALRNLGETHVSGLTSQSGLGHKLWRFDCYLEFAVIEQRFAAGKGGWAATSVHDFWSRVAALQAELFTCGVRVSWLKP